MALIERLTTRRKAATKGATDAQRALSELRALSARLRDQRAEVEACPVPLTEAQAAAASAVLREADRVIEDLSLASLMKPEDRSRPYLHLTADQRAALCFAAQAEGVVALLCAALARRYENMPPGLADDERAAQIARLDADALAAEMAEEGIIRSLEKDGLAPLRRADADARALLAHDAELN